ncbi:hypothetical protein PMAYCL1PPCAC_10289, partial [Pristionchus mayeri]
IMSSAQLCFILLITSVALATAAPAPDDGTDTNAGTQEVDQTNSFSSGLTPNGGNGGIPQGLPLVGGVRMFIC